MLAGLGGFFLGWGWAGPGRVGNLWHDDSCPTFIFFPVVVGWRALGVVRWLVMRIHMDF